MVVVVASLQVAIVRGRGTVKVRERWGRAGWKAG
jgi:hypothetical protein